MTDSERQDVENIARSFRAATGRPLIVNPSLWDQLIALGVDTSDIRSWRPIPTATRTLQ